MNLTFLGANRQVTGSCYCLEAGGLRLMIDCGLVQEREFLDRNWERCPFDESGFDALLLTHAHLDHCGLIPKLVRDGFEAPIHATPPTIDLVRVMLLDAAHIQEEDAAYKKRRHRKEGRQGAHPEVPLYNTEDAERALPLLSPVEFGKPLRLNENVSVTYHDAGHILGSAMLEITVAGDGSEPRTILFSGDIGQWDRPLDRDPSLFRHADYVVMESTYGDRDHRYNGDVEEQIGEIVRRTAKRGGNVVIPVFAVDRAQQLMHHISRLVTADRIPDIPIFLDSPMAVDVTEIYRRFASYLDDEVRALIRSGHPPLQFPGLKLVRNVDESKAINNLRHPCIIMSAAGMCTAGRIKHHLRNNISDPRNTILFVGFQAHGTLGRTILEGRKEVRIHGQLWPVHAEIAQVHGVSAHAGRSDLLRWIGSLAEAPRGIYITHGEEEAARSLAAAIHDGTGWPTAIPAYLESVELE